MTAPSKADKAVFYMLRRINRDDNLANLMLYTEALDLMLEAQAEALDVDYNEHRAKYLANFENVPLNVSEG